MTASTNGSSTRRQGVGPGFNTLCESVVQLAKVLPAPLQRLSLRVGEWAIDVEFAPAAPAPVPSPPTVLGAPPEPQPEVPTGTEVRSELVGTFFAGPAPGAEPFVRVGDPVDEGQQLGIVEAMKLMNAVSAPCPGTLQRVFVADGESVEYDQPLFILEPNEAPT